jgi:cytochrome c
MHIRNILPALLLVGLYGCQAEVDEQSLTGTAGYQLAQQNGCFACHTINQESICPIWRDVAAKYRNDAGAEARLTDKIATGGSGVWGEMEMPAHPQISEADRKTLAKFVLSLK